jgi:glycosyltransferase involved in cell wall biosynthesis
LGFKEAMGEIAVYLDADLEISPKYLLEIAKRLENGCDVAVASKHYPNSRFRSPFVRKLFGKTYTLLANTILGGHLRDYQGGMKGFRKPVIMKILPYLKDRWWFWDTEALMVSQWLGFRVCEVPIEGSYGFGESTVNVWKDSLKQFKGIVALKKRRMTELRALKPLRP